MADTAMIRLRAISPEAGKRVDDRMVSIDTFLSVGTTSARLLGPERSCPDRTFLPHLRSIVVKVYGARTTPRRPRIRAQSTALMENRSGSTVRADKASRGHGQTLRRWPSTSPPPPQGARECRRAHRRTTTGRLGRFNRRDSRWSRLRSEKMPAACEVRR